MKMVCDKNTDVLDNYHITIDKEYEVLKTENIPNGLYFHYANNYSGEFYVIIDDDGVLGLYPKELFITKKEHRHRKLKELGI